MVETSHSNFPVNEFKIIKTCEYNYDPITIFKVCLPRHSFNDYFGDDDPIISNKLRGASLNVLLKR